MNESTKLIISGHVQRLVRQALTAGAGALLASELIDAETAGTAIDTLTTGASAVITALVLAGIGYAWSSIRATKLGEMVAPK